MEVPEILVTVICIAYNHEKYIRDALEGFVMQKTTFPFEVIVHDDASADRTADIIREYEQKYPKIIKPIYQKENQYSRGVRIDRDIIMPLVKGKYVAFCEGDDYWIDSLKLQKQVDFLKEHTDYTMCVCRHNIFDVQTQCLIDSKNDVDDFDLTIDDCISKKCFEYIQTAGMLMCSDVYGLYPRWRNTWSVGDWPMLINAALHGKIRVLNEVMSVYRRNVPNSWTNRCNENVDYRVSQSENFIRSLDLLNEDTNEQYNRLIKREIIKEKLYIAFARKNRMFFLQNLSYLNIFSLKQRISYVLQLFCYPSYVVAKKIYHFVKD